MSKNVNYYILIKSNDTALCLIFMEKNKNYLGNCLGWNCIIILLITIFLLSINTVIHKQCLLFIIKNFNFITDVVCLVQFLLIIHTYV